VGVYDYDDENRKDAFDWVPGELPLLLLVEVIAILLLSGIAGICGFSVRHATDRTLAGCGVVFLVGYFALTPWVLRLIRKIRKGSTP